MRKVQVYKNVQKRNSDGTTANVKVADYVGTLHQFSHSELGGEICPSGIVERDDGFLIDVYVGLLQFIEPAQHDAEPQILSQ